MQCTLPIYLLVTYTCLLYMFICSCAVLVIEIPSTPCKSFHYIMKRFYGYVAHHVCSFCADKQPHQIKRCCNLIAASQKYLSPDTSLSHCERSKVILRDALVRSGTRVRHEEDHVDLLNLTEAMKRRSPGRDVCWCIQFEPLTLLACAQAHTDVGATGCSERTTQQMTPRWERCCGDREHERPEPCLHNWSQCDACGKQD